MVFTCKMQCVYQSSKVQENCSSTHFVKMQTNRKLHSFSQCAKSIPVADFSLLILAFGFTAAQFGDLFLTCFPELLTISENSAVCF